MLVCLRRDKRMRLIEALEIVSREPAAPTRRCALVCGITPLHLSTFLRAHLQLQSGARVAVETGLFGDLAGNLDRLSDAGPDGVAVVIEWPDLDPRLGLRQLGGWAMSVVKDVVQTAARKMTHLERLIGRAAESRRVVVSVPTLPLPPCFGGPGWFESPEEAELRHVIATFVMAVSKRPRVVVLNQQRLADRSPASERHDPRAELQTGLPYQQRHADVLASLLSEALHNAQPLKGIITDLDDTVWKGLLGEIDIKPWRGISTTERSYTDFISRRLTCLPTAASLLLSPRRMTQTWSRRRFRERIS